MGSDPFGIVIPPLDEALMARARQRLDTLTKPQGSLGRLETLAVQLVGITGRLPPSVAQKVVITMAADHGVTAEGVSAFPAVVTAQMLKNFHAGGAAINVLARQAGARVVVVDMGVGAGTANFARGPAMTRQAAEQAIEQGMAVVAAEMARGAEVIGLGEMGIGNTTAASALTAVFTGRPVADVTGRGTGVAEAALARKVVVIEQALAINRPDPTDPLGALAAVGGYEIAGLVGVILGAARDRRPVVLDGFITGAAALVAAALVPAVAPSLIAAHCSQEPGHRHALQRLGLTPLLDLQLRLGEGTGAALAFHLLEASCRIITEMATFTDAGVSERSSC